jgi:predicted O-methyltransferase YrrM
MPGPNAEAVRVEQMDVRRRARGAVGRGRRALGALRGTQQHDDFTQLMVSHEIHHALATDTAAWAPYIRWAHPGHFYSPIPSRPDVVADAGRIFDASARSLPAIRLDEDAIRQRFLEVSQILADWSFPEDPAPPLRYFTGEGNFAYGIGDGMMLHGMLRLLRPKRLIEVGSGFSSCVTLDTNERFLDGSVDLTFVEPYPELLLRLTAESPDSIHLLESRLQDVPTSLFESLGAGDVLFVDSTHVAKVGSDVVDLFHRVLPSLASGVVVHIHDVFWPFEYPQEWVLEGRAWNELYLLRAFLEFNDEFEILLFNDWMARFERPLIESHLPRMLENTGGALWLRRR